MAQILACLFLMCRGSSMAMKDMALDESLDIDDLIGSLKQAGMNFEMRQAAATAWPQRWKELYSQNFKGDALEEGALLLAEWGEGAVRTETRKVLDTLGVGVQQLLPRTSKLGATMAQANRLETVATVNAINQRLLKELGLSGNDADYYDPANSFLSAVLRRRLGIPISLSIIWVSVARRVGLSSYVLACFPGHVLVRVPIGDTGPIDDVYVDAFSGKVLGWHELKSFAFQRSATREQAALEAFVAPCSAQEVHARMLRNLRHIYESRGDDGHLLGVLDQAIAVSASERVQLHQHRDAVTERIHHGRTSISADL